MSEHDHNGPMDENGDPIMPADGDEYTDAQREAMMDIVGMLEVYRRKWEVPYKEIPNTQMRAFVWGYIHAIEDAEVMVEDVVNQ